MSDVFLVIASVFIFIAAVIYLVGNALVADPVWTGVTFAIVFAGVPVYFAAFRRPH